MSALTIILTLLLSYTVVFAGLATANPAPLFGWPHDPIYTSPTVTVSSPINNETYYSTYVLLNFTVHKPAAWFNNSENVNGDVFGNVTSVYYTIDGGERKNIAVHDIDTFFNIAEKTSSTLSFSVTLNLTAGQHSVRTGVIADSYYVTFPVNWYNVFSSVAVTGQSDQVNFTVNLPRPVIVTPESIAYNASSVPLAFTLDTSATSWVGYSLDGKSNATITGNTTLTGLSNGEHNITVYANDTFGNIGTSQTVNFTVALPPELKSFPTAMVTAVAAVSAVAVSAGLMVYFKKHKAHDSPRDEVQI